MNRKYIWKKKKKNQILVALLSLWLGHSISKHSTAHKPITYYVINLKHQQNMFFTHAKICVFPQNLKWQHKIFINQHNNICVRGIDVAGVWFSSQIEAINTKAESITSWSYELLMEKLHSDSDYSLTYANTSAFN